MESVTIDDKGALDPVVALSRPGRYKCSFHSGYSTNWSNDRPRHEATCDLNPDKQFGCSECKVFITGKLNYEKHVIIHIPGSQFHIEAKDVAEVMVRLRTFSLCCIIVHVHFQALCEENTAAFYGHVVIVHNTLLSTEVCCLTQLCSFSLNSLSLKCYEHLYLVYSTN